MAINIGEKIKNFLGRFKRNGSSTFSGSTTFSGDESTHVSGHRPLGSRAPGPIGKSTFKISRPPGEDYYKYLLVAALGYLTADLAILYYRDLFLPDQAPPSISKTAHFNPAPNKMDYDKIVNRNPFNSDGTIADALRPPEQKGQPQQQDGPAVPTTLTQLVLVGTLVHVNPARSVASIELKTGGSKIFPYFPNDPIESFATLVKVERKKAIFRNLQNGRLEYIEIKDDSALSFGRSKKEIKTGEVVQEGNNFALNRTDLNNMLKNLDSILQQATAVPNIVPGSGGQIDGFRLIDIQAGSIYEKFGLKKGDVIKKVNGEVVDSPNKALELYNALKNSGKISLDIDRAGRSENMNYQIE